MTAREQAGVESLLIGALSNQAPLDRRPVDCLFSSSGNPRG
jgi:hypothetical protein